MKIKNLFFAALSILILAACTDTPDSPYDFPGIGGNDNPTEEGTNLLVNSDFETWENNVPTGWGQTVSNCTYTQSTDAHSGSSAVVVEGYSQSNKRFASKSYTLKPGTYTISAYMKKSGEALGQYRLGYAKLTNGVVADTQNDYVYITSATTVPSDWKKATCNFTIDAETEVGIIIMNSKYGEGASILVDDVTLTTTDGGLVEGTDEPETPTDAYISETFATSFGAFTTQETVGNYPWIIDYSTAKATSYIDTNGDGQADTNKEATSWLVSPTIDLTNETEAYIAFEYIIRYAESGKVADNHQLLICSDFSGDVATASWTNIPYGAVEGVDWNTFYKANVAVPAEFLGKSTVTFALRYTATTKAGTWEVKNFVVAHGAATGETPEEPETPETGETIFAETFATSLGAFTTQETVSNYAWKFEEYNGKGYAKVSGYANGASQEAESWLVSPAINLSGVNAAYIAFDYVINKGDVSLAAANHKVMVTDNYTGDVASTDWIQVPFGAYNDNTWNFKSTGNIALPEAIMNKENVVIAFKYNSTAANSSTWEMNNLVVASGAGETPSTPETPEPDEPETPDTPDTPEAEAGVFDFTNPEALTPSVERATVEAGSTQGAGVEAGEYTFTNGNVTVKVSQGAASTPVRFWTRTGGDVELRTYKNSTITISVSEGTMSNIVFTGGKVSTMTADCGSFNAGTWSGDASSVTFTVSGTLNIQTITVK